MQIKEKQTHLFAVVVMLTVLFMGTQALFFFIHYKVGTILDSLANASVVHALFYPIVYIPLLSFFSVQLIAYFLFALWTWLVSISMAEFFNLSYRKAYACTVWVWVLNSSMLFVYNAYYFPASFFAYGFLQSTVMVVIGSILLVISALITLLNCFWLQRHIVLGITFIIVIMLGDNRDFLTAYKKPKNFTKPSIILIGLDSVRPDYVNYAEHQKAHTPVIDQFMQSAAVFTEVYTPLARTFPSWLSILTAQYPLHHQGRMNLAEPHLILQQDNLAKRLKANGYFTIYGTDETRFTDITTAYGFDRTIGPKGGAVEFLLGGLSDFPLTNLLINLPVGRLIFPYNYANRAADITYQPESFLKLVRLGLRYRPEQPVFLAIHLCLPHWPFRWAHDGQPSDWMMEKRYIRSIEAADAQLGKLLVMLKQEGLLQNALVFLLSDHGVTLGLSGDRSVAKTTFQGDPTYLHLMTTVKKSDAPEFTLNIKNDFSMNTSYGQGTDVLSLKQNHILLALQGFGIDVPVAHINARYSVLDVAPTILDYLQLPALNYSDGESMRSRILKPSLPALSKPFFMETGDKVADIESDKIVIDKVLRHQIGAYQVDRYSGQLTLIPKSAQSLIKNKQHAVLWGHWLLAHYPATLRYQFRLSAPHAKTFTLQPIKTPAYFVLVNLQTGHWAMDIKPPALEGAPSTQLANALRTFYGKEVQL